MLFPLLDKVKKCSSVAATEQSEPSGNILIHHSRDTAEKQWAETKVLTLAGVARVFNTWRYALLPLGNDNYLNYHLMKVYLVYAVNAVSFVGLIFHVWQHKIIFADC